MSTYKLKLVTDFFIFTYKISQIGKSNLILVAFCTLELTQALGKLHMCWSFRIEMSNKPDYLEYFYIIKQQGRKAKMFRLRKNWFSFAIHFIYKKFLPTKSCLFHFLSINYPFSFLCCLNARCISLLFNFLSNKC